MGGQSRAPLRGRREPAASVPIGSAVPAGPTCRKRAPGWCVLPRRPSSLTNFEGVDPLAAEAREDWPLHGSCGVRPRRARVRPRRRRSGAVRHKPRRPPRRPFHLTAATRACAVGEIEPLQLAPEAGGAGVVRHRTSPTRRVRARRTRRPSAPAQRAATGTPAGGGRPAGSSSRPHRPTLRDRSSTDVNARWTPEPTAAPMTIPTRTVSAMG